MFDFRLTALGFSVHMIVVRIYEIIYTQFFFFLDFFEILHRTASLFLTPLKVHRRKKKGRRGRGEGRRGKTREKKGEKKFGSINLI